MSEAPNGTLIKSPTGIEGLDEITSGGLPAGRSTLLVGGPGSGKTVLALQTLVNGVKLNNEPGIFVAFEESPHRLKANAASFGWDLPTLEQDAKLFFLDAQSDPDLVQAGNFDLSGLLALLTAKAREMDAKRIVFDSVDVLLDLLADPRAERREVFRLHEWLLAQNLSALVTAKVFAGSARRFSQSSLGFMPFMMDCAIALNHELVGGVSQRNLCVIKYRGSEFSENESPFVIGDHGFEVAGSGSGEEPSFEVTTERVASGIERLDTMLDGGYLRGAGILITGSPGTAKSTLCGAFAQAACQRGERTLFISFDSAPAEIARNLASVNIHLTPHQENGLLKLASSRAGARSAEVHFMKIKNLAREHRARCLVIDPVSALSKQGNETTAHSVVERLTNWAKAEGITLVCTSLIDGDNPELETTPLQISTIADSWIHLSYIVHAGERNRALTIIKSRGTAHSNQVRELTLRNTGPTLTDVYSSGGQVLMGTLRWEKEEAVRAEQQAKQAEIQQRIEEINLAETELANRLESLEKELAAKRAERDSLHRSETLRQDQFEEHGTQVKKLRGETAAESSKPRKDQG